jgi:putative two-component system response regulator
MPEEIILIVEDSEVLREGLRDMLAYEGYHVITASNGQEALEKLEETLPHLVLSDIGMPVMDGIELYNHVRSQQKWITIPFLFLTAKADPKDIMKGKNLGAEDYLTKPISREELVTTIKSRLSRARQVQMGQLQHAYLSSLTALANAVDRRQMGERGHIERVTAYCMEIAQPLNLSEWQLETLRYGAILHDIGKIHISEKILFKKDPLNQAEWDLIYKHPQVGAEMVRDVPALAEAASIIRHHHERWDGTGYPDGLAREQIPLGARIVAIADSFDSMIIPRPFKPAQTQEDTLQELKQLAGSWYDPQMVETFERIWQSGKISDINSLFK